MKKIEDGKKLALNIETIQTLTPNELDDVAGGADQGDVLRSSVQIICTKIPTCCVRDV